MVEREQDVLLLGIEARCATGSASVRLSSVPRAARAPRRTRDAGRGRAPPRPIPRGAPARTAAPSPAACSAPSARSNATSDLSTRWPSASSTSRGRDVVARADRLRRVEREAAGEHRQPLQQRALRRREQVVAPVDRRAQRLLARQRRRVAALQQREPVGQVLGDRFRPTWRAPAPRPARAPAGCRRGRGRCARRPRRSRASTRNPDGRRSRGRRNSCTAAYPRNASSEISLRIGRRAASPAGTLASPGTWSGSRLVAMIVSFRPACRRSRASCAHGEQQMLAIVEDERAAPGPRRIDAASR